MSLNKVSIIGNLGKDPEVRRLEGGAIVASFSLATTDKYTNKSGEKVEMTEWHNIIVWNKLAEICEKWLKKGMQVYIEGKIKTRKWEKDGVTHYSTEIFGDTMQMLGSKGSSDQSPGRSAEYESPVSQNGNKEQPASNEFTPQEDDLPF